MKHTPKTVSFYTEKDILKRGQFSAVTRWRLEKAGKFPAGHRFSDAKRGGLKRWVSTEVDTWFEDPAAWMEAQKTEVG